MNWVGQSVFEVMMEWIQVDIWEGVLAQIALYAGLIGYRTV